MFAPGCARGYLLTPRHSRLVPIPHTPARCFQVPAILHSETNYSWRGRGVEEKKRGEDVSFLFAEKLLCALKAQSPVKRLGFQTKGSVGSKWDGKLNEFKWPDRGGIVHPIPFPFFFKSEQKKTLITWLDLYSGTILWSQSTAFRQRAFLEMNSISLMNLNNDLRRIGACKKEDVFMGSSTGSCQPPFGGILNV